MAVVDNDTTAEPVYRPFNRPIDPRSARSYAPRGMMWVIHAPTIAAQDAADQTNIEITVPFDRNFAYRIENISLAMRSSTATNGVKDECQMMIGNYTDTQFTNFDAQLFIPFSSVQTRDQSQNTDVVYYPNMLIKTPLRAAHGSALSAILTVVNVDVGAQPAMTLDLVLMAYYYDLAQYDEVVMHTGIPTFD